MFPVEDAEVEVNFVSSEVDLFAQDVPLMNVNLPISVDRFFELFISDQASYSAQNFHETRGDTVDLLSFMFRISH
jgi:hypothetical protein